MPRSKAPPSQSGTRKQRVESSPGKGKGKERPTGTAPNAFALRPALNEKNTAQRCETAQIRALIAGSAALALIILVLVIAVRFSGEPPGPEPQGPIALASLSDNSLILMTARALLIHERSGLPRERLPAEALGVNTLAPPLWATTDNVLLLNAQRENEPLQFLRCDLDAKQCQPFFPEPIGERILAVTESLVGGSIFLMTQSGRVLRSSREGDIEEEVRLPRPWGIPRLLARDGLLFAPSDQAPMLGVFRPDRRLFGGQLDALMLVPEPATATADDRIQDLAMSSEAHWALLQRPASPTLLYRFDRQWGSPQRLELPPALTQPYLFSWRDKLLLADSSQPEILRFSSAGIREANLSSELLGAERERWLQQEQQRQLMLQLGVAVPLLLAVACALLALLYGSAHRVLPQLNAGHTDLLDPMPKGIVWLPAGKDKQLQLGRLSILMLALPLAGIGAAVLSGASSSALAFVPALLGAVYASAALRRGCTGQLGLLGYKTIAVDHENRYYFGPHNAFHGGRHILIAPSVALPIALPGLRNIDVSAHQSRLEVDSRKNSIGLFGVLAMLWQLGHPWGYAFVSLLGSWVLTLAGLVVIS